MSWLGRIFGRAAQQSGSECDRIEPADVKGYEGAVSLIPCAMQRGARALAFAERIEALLSELPVSRLSLLDRSIRDRSCWSGGWFSERSLGAVLPRHLPGHEDLFLCLALCHPSGYVRQAAIRKAAERLRRGTLSRNPARALQLLVLRRNDWVAAVAAEASRALSRLLVDERATSWVQALPLVNRLAHLGRRDHADFVEAVHAAARGAAWARPLMDGIGSRDRHVARSAVRCALASGALAQSEVVDAALRASDPVARLAAARAADEMGGADPGDALLLRLEADPYMPVRREALRLRGLWRPQTLGAAHQRLLLDPSRALRAQAQAAIATGGADPAAHYRACLRDAVPAHTAIALLGLAEVGHEGDAPRAEGFVDASRAKTRAAAIRCLARLAGDHYLDTFVAALRDASPRVCRAAAAGLHDRVHRAGIDRILAALDEPPHAHIERIVLRLLFETDQWAPLGPLVRYAARGDVDAGRWAGSRLRTWFTRHRGWSSRPPKHYVDALRVALADCGPRLDARARRELEFLMSTLTDGRNVKY